MISKKTLIGVASFFLVFTLFVGYFAIAAEIGGREDPLVTIGYLDKIDLDSKIKDSFDTYLADNMSAIDQKITDAYQRISEMSGSESGFLNPAEDQAFIDAVAEAVRAKIGVTNTGGTAGYEKVTIPVGKSMSMPIGTAFFLRVGSAVCVATGTPGFINTSLGTEVSNGGTIEKNFQYAITVDGGRALKNNGTNDVIVFVLGAYTIE